MSIQETNHSVYFVLSFLDCKGVRLEKSRFLVVYRIKTYRIAGARLAHWSSSVGLSQVSSHMAVRAKVAQQEDGGRQ